MTPTQTQAALLREALRKIAFDCDTGEHTEIALAALTQPAQTAEDVEVAGWCVVHPNRSVHLDPMLYTPGTPPQEVVEHHERLGRRIAYVCIAPPASQGQADELLRAKMAHAFDNIGHSIMAAQAQLLHVQLQCKVENLQHQLDILGQAQPMTDWQPIETAPKDGSLFLCWVSAVRYGETDEGQQYQQDVSQADFCSWRTQADIPDCGWFDPCCGQIGDEQGITHWMSITPPNAHHGITSKEGGEG